MAYKKSQTIETDNPLEALPPAKKSMVIFFLVDTSGSMQGEKMDSLNQVMGEILPDLIGVGEASTDVKVAVMSFASGFEWVTKEPVLIEEFQSWKPMKAEGVTDLGEACEELASKLSRHSFLQAPSLSYAPVIFLITDGYPTDNYQKGFEKCKENKWFQYALKIAMAIGTEADEEILSQFTGDPELVVSASNAKQLKKLIREIAVTSSKIGSTSMNIAVKEAPRSVEDVKDNKKEQMVEVIQEMKQDIMADENLEDMGQFDEGW